MRTQFSEWQKPKQILYFIFHRRKRLRFRLLNIISLWFWALCGSLTKSSVIHLKAVSPTFDRHQRLSVRVARHPRLSADPADTSDCLPDPADNSDCLPDLADTRDCLPDLADTRDCLPDLADTSDCLPDPAETTDCLPDPAETTDCLPDPAETPVYQKFRRQLVKKISQTRLKSGGG